MKNVWKNLNKPILALAPMAGITDSAFRQISKKYGADIVYSEMASASALFFKPEKTLHLLNFQKAERPYIVQLFGNKPEHFAKAVKLITEKIKPDGIDINFGCPAKKVFSHGSGCALMLNLKLSREIIKTVIENTSLPISLKIRAGVNNLNALEFIENVKDLDFKAAMVHGRTYEEKFDGKINLELIEKIKALVPNKIVLANGGVTTAKEGLEIIKEYPALDGLGIARGALGQPWIFRNIKKLLSQKKSGPLKFNAIKKIALEHAALITKTKKDRGILEIRKHLIWYFKGFPGAKEMRQKLIQVKGLKEIKEILNQF